MSSSLRTILCSCRLCLLVNEAQHRMSQKGLRRPAILCTARATRIMGQEARALINISPQHNSRPTRTTTPTRFDCQLHKDRTAVFFSMMDSISFIHCNLQIRKAVKSALSEYSEAQERPIRCCDATFTQLWPRFCTWSLGNVEMSLFWLIFVRYVTSWNYLCKLRRHTIWSLSHLEELARQDPQS